MRVHAWAWWHCSARKHRHATVTVLIRNSELNAVQSVIDYCSSVTSVSVKNEFKNWVALTAMVRGLSFDTKTSRLILTSSSEGPNHFFNPLPSCKAATALVNPSTFVSGATEPKISFSSDFWKLMFQTDLECNPTCKLLDITCRGRQRGVA